MKVRLIASCQTSRARLIQLEDRDLPWLHKLSMLMHLTICKSCMKFQDQLLFTKNAMKAWRVHSQN